MSAGPPMQPARRLDTTWHDGPAIRLQDHHGDWHIHTLTPPECYALVRKLVGYLGALHPDGNDATQPDTVEVRP